MTLTALTFVITDRGGRRVALIGPIAVAADRAVVGALDGGPTDSPPLGPSGPGTPAAICRITVVTSPHGFRLNAVADSP